MPLITTADRHAVKVKTCQFGESSGDTPKPYVALEFIKEDGETITGFFYLSEKAFDNTVRALREAFKWDNDFETLEAQCVDKECSITTDFEIDDKGVKRLKVKWLNPVGFGVKQLSNADTLLKRFSALAKGVAAKAPAKPLAQAQKAPPVGSTATAVEDDPFARK